MFPRPRIRFQPVPRARGGAPERKRSACILVLSALFWHFATEAHAAWPATGRSLCNGCTGSYFHRLAPDGAGGAYVLWTDSRNSLTTDDDIFLQRILASGDIAAGWPAAGLPICDTTFSQRGLDLISDGAGGAIAMWTDNRAQSGPVPQMHPDLFAQRVLPDGSTSLGWLPQGSPVTRAVDRQLPSEWPSMAPDGGGGALIIWEDSRDNLTSPGRDVYLQHLSGAGVPAPGWPTDGRLLSSAPDYQRGALVAVDGAGGAFAAWTDYRNHPGDFDQFLQGQTFASRVLADGSDAPGWTPGGQLLHAERARPDAVVPDGLGGAFVVLAFPTGDSQGESLFVALRLTASGAPAPGWPAEGITLCNAPGRRHLGPSTSDGHGGLLTTWTDGRVFVTRLRPDGSRPPGWPVNGLHVSSPVPTPYGEFKPSLAPDGSGGCYVAWERPGDTFHHSVIQHISATGIIAPGWPVGGTVVPVVSLGTVDPVLVADGLGGAIVVYSSPTGSPYAMRYVADGVVATTVSLVRAEARQYAVELHWHAASSSFRATLERRDGMEEAWITLAELSPDGTGTIRFTDRDVVPGACYAYRLRWDEHGAMRVAGETAVEVPSALRFALHGVQPNPARGGEAQLAFTLPTWASGELEVLDISGRRVTGREVGSLGPGRHVVRLDERDSLAPGLYLVRLRWRGESATTRAVLVR